MFNMDDDVLVSWLLAMLMCVLRSRSKHFRDLLLLYMNSIGRPIY